MKWLLFTATYVLSCGLLACSDFQVSLPCQGGCVTLSCDDRFATIHEHLQFFKKRSKQFGFFPQTKPDQPPICPTPNYYSDLFTQVSHLKDQVDRDQLRTLRSLQKRLGTLRRIQRLKQMQPTEKLTPSSNLLHEIGSLREKLTQSRKQFNQMQELIINTKEETQNLYLTMYSRCMEKHGHFGSIIQRALIYFVKELFDESAALLNALQIEFLEKLKLKETHANLLEVTEKEILDLSSRSVKELTPFFETLLSMFKEIQEEKGSDP